MIRSAVAFVIAFWTSSAIGQDTGSLQSGVDHLQAPDHFQVILETNVQNACPVVLNVTRTIAPNSADDFWSMVKHIPPIFYNSAIYKVVPGSYVQFGVSGDPTLNSLLGESPLSYDIASIQNTYGTVAFITSPTQTLGLQIAISLQDNHDFDRLNMVPFGYVSFHRRNVSHGHCDDMESKDIRSTLAFANLNPWHITLTFRGAPRSETYITVV